MNRGAEDKASGISAFYFSEKENIITISDAVKVGKVWRNILCFLKIKKKLQTNT